MLEFRGVSPKKPSRKRLVTMNWQKDWAWQNFDLVHRSDIDYRCSHSALLIARQIQPLVDYHRAKPCLLDFPGVSEGTFSRNTQENLEPGYYGKYR
jgi:hypothetical protein